MEPEAGSKAISPSLARRRRMQLRAGQKALNQATLLDQGAKEALVDGSSKRKRVTQDIRNDETKKARKEGKNAKAKESLNDRKFVLSKNHLASIRGVKKMSRYDPGIPMTKEELTLWRKEARRVRNRESASASRQKTRQRIEELEDEVGSLRSKYSAALRRIEELEAAACTSDSFGGSSGHCELNDSSCSQEVRLVSPPLSPRHGCDDISDEELSCSPQRENEASKINHQHINQIHRQEAVKIFPGVDGSCTSFSACPASTEQQMVPDLHESHYADWNLPIDPIYEFRNLPTSHNPSKESQIDAPAADYAPNDGQNNIDAAIMRKEDDCFEDETELRDLFLYSFQDDLEQHLCYLEGATM